MAGSSTTFLPGDLVISIYGDGNADGSYADNQASPIVLEQLTITGTVTGSLVLPQTTSANASGTKEYAISGEYGSSSEGTLQLSTDGHSLTIAGYAINANTYNQGEAGLSSANKTAGGTYGNAALAQSTSLSNSTTYVPVQRVVADISADANGNSVVDTSTALYNVFNTNNPRSVVTMDGKEFWIAGQGKSGDTTQGLFYVADGGTTATPINTATDLRTAEIYNGTLYTSTDSKQPSGTGTSNISSYGGEPTTATTPSILPGINKAITLTAAQENSINGGSVGTSVNLSPENYFFVNATNSTPLTLYVADGGLPKQGGVGDGGLQKWVFNPPSGGNSGSWSLAYTLSSGLNLVNGTTATSGTTGLIGLTGSVTGNTVSLYATNSTIGDTDQTYLYGITDTLSATTLPAGETFQTLATAAPDTNIRGVAFAPTAIACYGTGTLIRVIRDGGEAEIPVERLQVGDFAVTSSGTHKPIRWIGHRTLDPRRHAQPQHAHPVRVRAHAFAPGRPARDLLVSPGHALCLDLLGEVLIPASALINGSTVVQEEVTSVTYWHVELDDHDILLAEAMPAESYIDCGNRGFFSHASSDKGGTLVDLAAGPDGRLASDTSAAALADYCRPFHGDGDFVAVARAQLRRRLPGLGWRLVQPEPWENVALVVDGHMVLPETRGLSACFTVPAMLREGGRDIRLRCPVGVPAAMDGRCDPRPLGLCLGAITLDDGRGERCTVALDDPLLDEGFHAHEGTHRWTGGEARLPAALFAHLTGTTVLRLELVAPPVPRWVAPAAGLPDAAAETNHAERPTRLVLVG